MFRLRWEYRRRYARACIWGFCGRGEIPLRRDHVRTEKDAEQTGKEYPTDVGLWQIPATHDMHEFWAETGSEPCQNKKSEYPASWKTGTGRYVISHAVCFPMLTSQRRPSLIDRGYATLIPQTRSFLFTAHFSLLMWRTICSPAVALTTGKTFSELSLHIRKVQIILNLWTNTLHCRQNVHGLTRVC